MSESLNIVNRQSLFWSILMGMLKIVLWEFLVLVASVLVFRSFWTLLDGIPEMNNEFAIWSSLILGAVVALTAIFMVNKYAEKQKKNQNEERGYSACI